MDRTNRQRGFTILELAIATTIGVLLISSVMSIALETSTFVTSSDMQANIQQEGNRAFARLSDVLRKSGRAETGTGIWPRVIDAGAGLEFRVLKDLDGNGYAFADGTSTLEWSAAIYSVRLDATGSLDIWQGGSVVYHLGRNVRNVVFETIAENSSLHMKEVHVQFETRRASGLGFDMVHSVSGSVLLRN